MKYLKRLLKFIIKGQPKKEVKVTIGNMAYGKALENKRIFITGGTKGIGYAIAEKCINEGAIVCIAGRKKEALEKAKSKLGENCKILEYDITDFKDIDSKIEKVAELLGGNIDCLVNNAGISLHEENYLKVTQESYDKQFDTNLKAPYFITQSFMKFYYKNKNTSGKIIMMVSERGLYGDDIPYGLTKNALISYTKGLAKRTIEDGVRVNAIAPGVVATEMTNYSPDGDLYREQALGKRVLLSSEIAEITAFLLSDASNCISGEVIACNEGNHLK